MSTAAPLRAVTPKLERQIDLQRQRVFAAMAIVGCAEHSCPREALAGEPDLRKALRVALDILDRVAADLELIYAA